MTHKRASYIITVHPKLEESKALELLESPVRLTSVGINDVIDRVRRIMSQKTKLNKNIYITSFTIKPFGESQLVAYLDFATPGNGLVEPLDGEPIISYFSVNHYGNFPKEYEIHIRPKDVKHR